MTQRSRKSKIARLPPEQREFIERLLREDRYTLDELMAAIAAQFPSADVSRSGLHRYQANFAEMAARMREIDRAAEVLVGELGEGIGEKSGALLAHAVTTLATHAAMRAQNDSDVTIDDIRKISITARNALDTRRLSLAERKAIRQEAREELQREQAAKLSKHAKEAGLTDEAAAVFRRKVLGLPS